MGRRLLPGIEPLAHRYEGFLIDQFGVLHDGVAPYPGVLSALELLKASGKPVVVLSNSGRRSAPNEARLDRIGIPRHLYDDVLTSGEAAWEGLRAGSGPVFRNLGRHCLLFSRGGDLSPIEGLDLELVESPEAASFIFLAGVDPTEDAAARARNVLKEALRLELPVLCTNPDRAVIEGDRCIDGPGALAARHAAAGGEVRYVGKPAPAIFERALLKLDLPARSVLMIGDSLEHDISGAQGCAIDAALVTSGVHRQAFAGARDGRALVRAAERLSPERTGRPRWLLEGFRPAPSEDLVPA